MQMESGRRKRSAAWVSGRGRKYVRSDLQRGGEECRLGFRGRQGSAAWDSRAEGGGVLAGIFPADR